MMGLTKEYFDFVKFFTSKGAINDSKCGFRDDLPETTRKGSDGKNL